LAQWVVIFHACIIVVAAVRASLAASPHHWVVRNHMLRAIAAVAGRCVHGVHRIEGLKIVHHLVLQILLVI
jgi:hypothetical protein